MSQGFTSQLPIPLPVAQGGTGVVTSTGTGDTVLSNSPTLTTPIMEKINDSNGNAYIEFMARPSPVSWLTVQSAGTGEPVILTPAGSDTNIPIVVGAKGSSQVRITSDLFLYNTGGGNNYTAFYVTATGAQTITLPNASGTIQLQQSSPTIQTFTSGSGTYTTPAGVKYIAVTMVGGGGGGGGSSTVNNGGTGGTGGNTTFGSSLLTANGGAGGTGGNPAVGGAGGTATLNSPAIGISFTGQQGGDGEAHGGYAINQASGAGGNTPFCGAGSSVVSSSTAIAGRTAVANTGSGGSGAAYNRGTSGSSYWGAGGGAGGYIQAVLNAPSATYSYSVGTAGAAGTAGTSGAAGGAGAAGVIIVTEYYQ